jgi:hypothetical protein
MVVVAIERVSGRRMRVATFVDTLADAEQIARETAEASELCYAETGETFTDFEVVIEPFGDWEDGL